ncbi:DUF6660 family protein [Spirosoma terrae]|uniref:Uncharacterized protein n=1 Tax=Spirosoma terrae TaxID=1968276 RepID=A0A6L9L9Q2_9BACT|nr:DUF6660 family protein [Spirosoma terrae]NDU95118.1 hypothetical protein [Spirosoma terrae]
MKVVVYVFSLWILLLSGLPCPDADCHAHERVTANTATSQHTDEQDHKAPCSPFCHCATCLGFSVPLPFGYTRPAQSMTAGLSQQIFTYLSPFLADVARSVWQPPKL